MDEFDGLRPAMSPSVARRNARSALWLAAVLAGLTAVAACGSSAPAAKTSVAGGSTGTTTSPPTTAIQAVAPATSCPLTAAAVSMVVGVQLHEETSKPAGSCAFDSIAGGTGLRPSEIRVDIQTGPDELPSLYTFFAQRSATDFSSCRPFQLLRRTDLGAGAFETACGAAATSGPASVDIYLPTVGSGQLTVTVNRGTAVPDHRVATCAAEISTLVDLIRSS